MNTNLIKKFACEARNILKRGIKAKIKTLGFDDKGNVSEDLMPQLMQGGTLWKGELYSEGFYQQWMSLYHRVMKKGIIEVYEEAAYTWFNRLIAIRILQKNGLCEPVLAYTDAARTPRIVNEARMDRMPQMAEDTRSHLMTLLDDDTKVTEQFAVLISAWCHDNPIMQACFGGMEDYTELLLPNNILAEGGFVDLINDTDFITDEDFHSPELIGWLYQFYISERKDEVFAKKGKFEADEIPAATQIFTPNWIVKYMVQNTVGRIFLDNNRGANAFKDQWQYLVDQEQTSTENIYHYDELTDLKVADLACGSGHILNECFDLLYDLYIYEGYSRSEAIENIFEHNLTGIDLDNRAKQLATFALMIKACQKDRSFVDAHTLPKVLTMPTPYDEEANGAVELLFHEFFQGSETKQIVAELKDAFCLMKDADSLGSIMKFKISDSTRYALAQTMDYWKKQEFTPKVVKEEIPAFELILTLTQGYSALIMNPPYMGGGNMNGVLSKYVKDHYKEGKADLCTVFMQMAKQHTVEKGSYGFIIPPSWLFLSTFENLRRDIIDTQSIESMLHLSRGVFGADFGGVSFVIKNHENKDAHGTYFRLIERTFQEFDQKHLQMLFEQTLDNQDFKYDFKGYNKNVTSLPYSEDGNKIYYPNIAQKNFEKIPGCPIGYWVSEKVFLTFSFPSFINYGKGVKGLDSGDNNKYIRNVWEINSQSNKWLSYCSGGPFRKWYGNNAYVIDYKNVIQFKGACVRNKDLYFKEGFEWSRVSSNHFGVRKISETIFGGASQMAFVNSDLNLNFFIALYNTKIVEFYIKFLNPTMITQAGDINRIPISKIYPKNIDNIVNENIAISRQDWDSHETSWDFEQNELFRIAKETGNITSSIEDEQVQSYQSLELLLHEYKAEWEGKFNQLHANEEELNRQFIDIYGLQDELTPDVPLGEITILQQGEISIETEKATTDNA